MIDYRYTYLILTLLLFCIWLTLFITRKDSRKEMLAISLIFGIAGPIAEVFYIKDWWQPSTITNTIVGIEAVLTGFFIGGIASVIYTHLFRKKTQTKKPKNREKEDFRLGLFGGILVLTFLISTQIFKLNSLYGTILAFFIPTLIIWIQRKDLISDSIISGISTMLILIIVYSILNLISPGWIEQFFLLNEVGARLVAGIPLKEFLWYFFAGAFIGPFYEHWKEKKLVKVKNK